MAEKTPYRVARSATETARPRPCEPERKGRIHHVHRPPSHFRSTVQIALLAGLVLVLIVSLSSLFAGRAQAEHGGPIHGPVMARAPLADSTAIQLRGLVGGNMSVSNARDLGDTVVQQITVAPGGFTGWHTHHGPVVVLVESGEFTVYQANDPDCTPFKYGPDEAFIDPGQGNVHGARNEGTEPMIAWAVYFDVPAGNPQLLIPAASTGNCEF